MVYFSDSNGVIVSDTQRIIADRTSDTAQNRIFTAGFSLRDLGFESTDSYYLTIATADGEEIHREEFEIAIAHEDVTNEENDYFV